MAVISSYRTSLSHERSTRKAGKHWTSESKHVSKRFAFIYIALIHVCVSVNCQKECLEVSTDSPTDCSHLAYNSTSGAESSPCDGSDATHFRCQLSHRCIARNLTCDSKHDCGAGDYSDEEDCHINDVLILSAWESLKVWTSDSTIHSAKTLTNFDALKNNSSIEKRKITAVDYYYDTELCEIVLIWSDVSRRSIYTAFLNLTQSNPYLSNVTAVMENDFVSHVRLAVDRLNKITYLALFDAQRIDFFDHKTKALANLVSNISRPIDIVIDSERQILFWIEKRSCISQFVLQNGSLTRMCSSKPRALALDVIASQLYWCDSDGNILVKSYYSETFSVFTSNKKITQSYALDMSDNFIYLSDQYKLTSLMKTTKVNKVVLIESPGILDFKVIKTRSFGYCRKLKHDLLSNNTFTSLNNTSDAVTSLNNYSYSVKSFDSTTDTVENDTQIDITTNIYLKHINYTEDVNRKTDSSYNYFTIILYGIVLIALCLFCLVVYAVRRYIINRLRRESQRESSEVRNRLIVKGKNRKTFTNRNVSKTVCIEDLEAFGNNSYANGYLDPQWMCSNCPIRQTCSSCDDKQECLDVGICLNTYKLLT